MSYWSECPECGKRYMTELGHKCRPVESTLPAPLLQPRFVAPTVRAARKQEADVAKKMGGKVVLASGALPGSGGDVDLPDYLVECKTTQHKQYTLTVRTWQKIAREAALAGKIPLMQIDMNGTRLAVMTLEQLMELLC